MSDDLKKQQRKEKLAKMMEIEDDDSS